jgi:hypothetical protein
MDALAREISNFKYGPLKINGGTARVVHGPYDDFVKFLKCDFLECDCQIKSERDSTDEESKNLDKFSSAAKTA